MSDEEEVSEEVEEEEEEEAEAIPAPAATKISDSKPEEEQETPKLRKPPVEKQEDGPKELTEAELAMLAAKKRHEEEEALKMQDYEEKRRLEREQEEEELRQLKEKQEERKRQREEEDKEMAERVKADELRRKADEEDRYKKAEEERRKKKEEKEKKLALMAGSFSGAGAAGGKNYTVNKHERRPFGTAPSRNVEEENAQKSEAKKSFLAAVNRKVEVSNLLPNDLKAKILQLHQRIIKLEAEKYDLEKRHERQQYDLKELHDRELQAARNKAIKRGLDPNEAVASEHPPKVNVASKFDRQTDSRSYADRRNLYEKPIMKKRPKIAHGTARPPPEWGRRDTEELEQIRKNAEGPKYKEIAPVEGDLARPPVHPIPLIVPNAEDVEEEDQLSDPMDAPLTQPAKPTTAISTASPETPAKRPAVAARK